MKLGETQFHDGLERHARGDLGGEDLFFHARDNLMEAIEIKEVEGPALLDPYLMLARIDLELNFFDKGVGWLDKAAELLPAPDVSPRVSPLHRLALGVGTVRKGVLRLAPGAAEKLGPPDPADPDFWTSYESARAAFDSIRRQPPAPCVGDLAAYLDIVVAREVDAVCSTSEDAAVRDRSAAALADAETHLKNYKVKVQAFLAIFQKLAGE